MVKTLWLGTWRLGGEGFGPSNLKESIESIEYAYELGIRHFDTANFYAHGKSNAILSKLTKKYRSSLIVSSKGGLVWETPNLVKHDASKEALTQDLHETLKRLGTDYLDYYLLHWPDPTISLERSLEVLLAFQREGLIKKWGVCNLSIKMLNSFESFIRPLNENGILHQVHHNILHQQNEILQIGANLKLRNIIYSPFEQGLLANPISRYQNNPIGYIRKKNSYFSNSKIHQKLHFLEKKLKENGIEKKEYTLYWLLKDFRCADIILGSHSIEQLNGIFTAIASIQKQKDLYRNLEKELIFE